MPNGESKGKARNEGEAKQDERIGFVDRKRRKMRERIREWQIGVKTKKITVLCIHNVCFVFFDEIWILYSKKGDMSEAKIKDTVL